MGKFGISFLKATDAIRSNGRLVFLTAAVSFLLMSATCVAVFFFTVQGAERVLVPDVVGKRLVTALIEMQERELYAKIQLKHSELPGERGTVLEQEPKPGAIVKAYRRVTLTVSRGILSELFQDYTGKDIDDTLEELELSLGGENSHIKISNPVFLRDNSAPGTIIAQFPQEGTEIAEMTKIQFVVSSGSVFVDVKIPDITGLTIKQALSKIGETVAVFDFSLEESSDAPSGGSIVWQDLVPSEKADSYVRVNAVLAVRPERGDNVQGILKAEFLPDYPFPVPMSVEAQSSDGNKSTLVNFSHPGRTLTIPYDVKKDTTLTLYVMGEKMLETVVR